MGHPSDMTTVLGILLVLVVWTVLSLPLAVLVGRRLAARDEVGAVDAVPRPDLTFA